MSQENVEVVTRSLKAFADEGLDALAEFWDADITWRAIPGAPDDVGEMRGRDAARRYTQDWPDTFENFAVVPEELLDLGDDRLLAVLRLEGRARQSGAQSELRYAVLYRLCAGKIVDVREYADRDQAVEALGRKQ